MATSKGDFLAGIGFLLLCYAISTIIFGFSWWVVPPVALLLYVCAMGIGTSS